MRISGSGQAVLAWCGEAGIGPALADWFDGGAIAGEFPPCVDGGANYAQLVAIFGDGSALVYQGVPFPVTYSPEEAKGLAWGSGAQVAIGFMAAGGTALAAVMCAGELMADCGGGYASIELLSLGGEVPNGE